MIQPLFRSHRIDLTSMNVEERPSSFMIRPSRVHRFKRGRHLLSLALISTLTLGVAYAQSNAPSTTPPIQQQQQPMQQQQQQQPMQQQQQPIQQQVLQQAFPNTLNSNQKMRPSNQKPSKESTAKAIQSLPKVEGKRYAQPQVQIAILLDVSGSMDGLINQARSELWKIINSFEDVTFDGKEPEIRVALYSYGMSDSSGGLYLSRLMPLTTDLDRISESLYALKTSGSAEFCGSVLYAAADGLAWSTTPSDLKAIIIAGNETFAQGPIPSKKGISQATQRGVITHAIHCGDAQRGISDGWRNAARQGEGQFMNIDQDAKQQYIETPYDDEIEKLGDTINKTYIPYGEDGMRGAKNQVAQDRNAKEMSKSSMVQRSLAKSSKYYSNAKWDLIDAVKRGQVKVEELKEAQLPETFKNKTTQARLALIEEITKERARLKSELAKLKLKHESFVSAKRAALSGQTKRIDSAMINALKTQAKSLGFSLSAPAKP